MVLVELSQDRRDVEFETNFQKRSAPTLADRMPPEGRNETGCDTRQEQAQRSAMKFVSQIIRSAQATGHNPPTRDVSDKMNKR